MGANSTNWQSASERVVYAISRLQQADWVARHLGFCDLYFEVCHYRIRLSNRDCEVMTGCGGTQF